MIFKILIIIQNDLKMIQLYNAYNYLYILKLYFILFRIKTKNKKKNKKKALIV